MAGLMILVYAFALNQVKPVERDGLRRESTAQENKADELKKGAEKIVDEHAEEDIEEHADTQQVPFWDDYFWFKKVYDEAGELAEEHGLHQFLDIEKTWISASGDYCVCFVAEYSDIGIYLKAQSADIYELTFRDSIYTEGFAGMNYRVIDVDKQKVPMIEEIILQNGINERCTLHSMDDRCALVSTTSGIWYSINMAEKTITQMDSGGEGTTGDEENWDFHGAWGNAYREVLNDWTKIIEFEKEFVDTLGGTVQYDPHLINYIGNDLIFERYVLHDLDKDGIPELILLSDHSSSMNAIFTYTDRLVYCGTYYNALYTDDGKIIERGSWWAGSAMIIDPWYITEIKAGRIVTEESIWGEYLDHEESEIRYMQHIGEEAEEISYEEYRDIKNALLCNADFVRNMPSKELCNLLQELLSGNFEHLSGEYSDYRELFEMDWERGESEWRQIDLNGDGVEDFILQEAKPIGDTGQKRIIGIFTIEEDSIRCIMADFNDGSEYSFCGTTGKLMYTASNYGGVVDNEPYDCYHYDNEWQEIIDYRLEILRVNSEVDEDYAKVWKSENSDMAEDGLYYFRYMGDKEEKLTKEEWTSIYEAETGLKFDGSDLL